jgi:hypothetical protein
MNLAIALFAYCLALVFNLVNALSVPLVVLLLAGRFVPVRGTPPAQAERALKAYIAISALSLLLFLFIMQFLTQRYAALLALLVLARVPLVLDDIYARAQSSPELLRRFRIGFAAFAVYFLVDSLFSFGYSNRHIDEGIAWSRERLPAGAPMKTNNFAIAYHSGRVTAYDETVRDPGVVLQSSVTGDYLVLDVDRGDDTSLLDTNPQLIPVDSFANERGDEVRVYLHR